MEMRLEKGKSWCQKKVKHISELSLILFSTGDAVFAESENIPMQL